MNTAIIVLNYNDYETTSQYITRIKEYKSIQKIIVVDNNSPSNDYEKLLDIKHDKIDVVKSDKNGGYSYGNNYGVKYAEKKYGANYFDTYIISNPDIFVDDKVIEESNFKLHSNSSIAVVSPRMYYESGPARRSAWKKRTYFIDIANSTRITEFLLFPLFKKGEYTKKDFENEELKVDAIAGSFFLIKAKILKDIGYFDENTFLFYEEDILGEKIRNKKYKIISLNNSKFLHLESKTIGKLMNLFRKQKILFASRKYFHKEYNKVSNFRLKIFDFLYIIRCIELVVEIPIRKLKVKIIKKEKTKNG